MSFCLKISPALHRADYMLERFGGGLVGGMKMSYRYLFRISNNSIMIRSVILVLLVFFLSLKSPKNGVGVDKKD